MGLLDLLDLLLLPFFFVAFFALFWVFLAFWGKLKTVISLSFRSKSLPFLLPGRSFRAKSLSFRFGVFLVKIEDILGAFGGFFCFSKILKAIFRALACTLSFLSVSLRTRSIPGMKRERCTELQLLCQTSCALACHTARAQYYNWSKSTQLIRQRARGQY